MGRGGGFFSYTLNKSAGVDRWEIINTGKSGLIMLFVAIVLCCSVTYCAEKLYSANSQLINTHLSPASSTQVGPTVGVLRAALVSTYVPLTSFSHH